MLPDGEYPECVMLDQLVALKRCLLFDLVAPPVSSNAGKQQDRGFGFRNKTAPMVFSQEAGLGGWECMRPHV